MRDMVDAAPKEAGGPGSIEKHGLRVTRTSGKSKLAAELNVVGDPIVYLNHKLIKFLDGDQEAFHWLRTF